MPHRNDMTHWDEIACQRGCDIHPTRTVPISLGGPTAYRDLTPIPERFAAKFDLNVWDTHVTPLDGLAYCPARDAVSETILSHGVWEPQETAVLLLCWEALGDDCLFLDVGAQIGWFSTLAVSRGIRTWAFEADLDVAELLRSNMRGAGGRVLGVTFPFRIDTDSPMIDPVDAPVVAKIDIEGAERVAIQMLGHLIVDGSLHYILMEVSPVFNDTYPGIAEDLIASGYRMYTMPPKQNPPVAIDQLTDLIPYEVTGDVAAEVASWHQKDVLFVLGGIEP